MSRSTIATLVVASLGLAACTTGQASTAQPNTTDLLSTPQPNIIVNTGETQSGILVSGTGEVTGTPDTVSVDLGVSVLGDTVAEATTLAAEKADALINSLTSGGVDAKDITTTNYSIWPEYDWRNDRERLVGYRVNNTVRAKIRNVTEAADVIDAATAAAGDEVRVNGLQFSIEDDGELIEAAREAAWNDAVAKAEQLAQLSGQTLGAAISITETVSRPPTPIYFEEYASADGAAIANTPIEPGTSAVRVSLQVQFDLES